MKWQRLLTVAEGFLDGVYVIQALKESLDTNRIELATRMLVQIVLGICGRPGCFVGSWRDQRIIYVGYCDNARNQRYILTGEAVRITAAIESFMMVQRNC